MPTDCAGDRRNRALPYVAVFPVSSRSMTSRSPKVDKAEEEMERGQRPWLPSSRRTGRGRGILPTDRWPPESEVKLERAWVNPGVEPPRYGRPRGDAGAYPGGDPLIHRPVAPWPGSEGAAPWAGPREAGCLDGQGRWVKRIGAIDAVCKSKISSASALAMA